jgi:hypothetical protein
MKTAAIPAVRVPPELRQAAEELLADGETLSGFVEDAVRRNVEYRRAQAVYRTRPGFARQGASFRPRSRPRPFLASSTGAWRAQKVR